MFMIRISFKQFEPLKAFFLGGGVNLEVARTMTLPVDTIIHR